MTTETKNRSAKTYVRIIDRIRKLSAQLSALESAEKAARQAIIDELQTHNGRMKTRINGDERFLAIGEKLSISAGLPDAELVAIARERGVTVSERSAEYVAPATLRSAYLSGIIGDDACSVTRTLIVTVH